MHASSIRTTALLLALAVTGCTHIGPTTVIADRFDYSTAIADSWKQQTLLNIVKMRYMDLPVFVDVASIVSGYTLQTGVTVGGTLSSERAVQGDFFSGSGQAIYTDRPTITYVPLTGDKFMRGLLAPIDPKNIFFMLQSGYAADFILGLTVESLNGVRNRSAIGSGVREADPEFIRALQLIREAQLGGAVGMRVEEDKVKGSTTVLLLRRDDVAPEIVEKSAEVRRLLKLPPDLQKYTLIYSPARGEPHELAVNSRSMLQIMGAFASYLDVPEAHRQDRSAIPGLDQAANAQRPVRIHSGLEMPKNAYAAVRYREHWFWIEESDWQTKRALTAIMFFFTLSDFGGNDRLPLVTIPAQ
jgi:hypothetical protein